MYQSKMVICKKQQHFIPQKKDSVLYLDIRKSADFLNQKKRADEIATHVKLGPNTRQI